MKRLLLDVGLIVAAVLFVLLVGMLAGAGRKALYVLLFAWGLL